MPLGVHIFEYFDYERGIQQTLGRFVGDHIADENFGKFIHELWYKMKIVKGMNIWTCWFPLNQKPYKPLTEEQKLKRRRTKFINKIKNKYPLFAMEFIKERYPDFNQ